MTSLPFSTSLFIYPEAYFDALTDISPDAQYVIDFYDIIRDHGY